MKNTVNVKEVSTGSLHNRRSFLKLSGLAVAGTGLIIAGCSSDDDGGRIKDENQLPGVRNGVFDLGGGDLGILTYAYALEQLEADFYDKVVNSNTFGSTFNADERAVLEDLYYHEVIHREFFKAAISSLVSPERVLPGLDFSYSGVNFGNRESVLGTAMALEDTGVSAYNGAGMYISEASYLLIAGKIVSVEARHASAIRSILNPGTADFAGDDIINDDGLEVAQKPSEIVTKVSGLDFIQTPFTAKYLP
jgi:rubrerythrin